MKLCGQQSSRLSDVLNKRYLCCNTRACMCVLGIYNSQCCTNTESYLYQVHTYTRFKKKRKKDKYIFIFHRLPFFFFFALKSGLTLRIYTSFELSY